MRTGPPKDRRATRRLRILTKANPEGESQRSVPVWAAVRGLDWDMNEIGSVNEKRVGPGPQIERSASEAKPARPVTTARVADGDRVELSEAAAQYDPQAVADAAMDARIRDIRARIADGTYLTEDKLNAVVDALFRELVGAA